MDKKRAITQFLTLCNHFENRTSIAPSPPKHLQVRHSRIALILRRTPNPPLVNSRLISFSRAAITLLRFLTTQLNVNRHCIVYQWKKTVGMIMTRSNTIKRCDYKTLCFSQARVRAPQGARQLLASSGFSCCVPSWRLSALVRATARVS